MVWFINFIDITLTTLAIYFDDLKSTNKIFLQWNSKYRQSSNLLLENLLSIYWEIDKNLLSSKYSKWWRWIPYGVTISRLQYDKSICKIICVRFVDDVEERETLGILLNKRIQFILCKRIFLQQRKKQQEDL